MMRMTTTAMAVLVFVAVTMMMMIMVVVVAVVMKEVKMGDVAMSAVKPFVQSRDPSKVRGTCRT